MTQGSAKGRSWTKAVVIVAIVGSAAFALYLGYLAWSYDSFPVQERTFGDYAQVMSTAFNGTDVSFQVKWLSSGFLPLKAQLTSATTDAANSPTCWLDLANVSAGEVIPMPFGVSKPTPVITDISLYVAVRDLSTGQEFTIVYSLASVSAQQGEVMPSTYSCSQPVSAM